MRKIQLACILLLTAALAFTMAACTFGDADGGSASGNAGSTADLAALHALHFSADNAAGGTVTARTAQVVLVDGQEIAEGTTVYLAALPADGYDFGGWYEGDAKVGSELIYTFTITKDRTLVAKFTQKQQFTLTYSAENSAWGSVSGSLPSGTRVASGTAVTLTAAPASGYDFDGWYEAGVKIGEEPRCTVTVTADRNLLAKFTAQATTVTTHTVTFVVDGQTIDTQQVTSGQCAAVPTAPQVSGQRFVGWFNGSAAYDFSAPVTGNLTLTARFESAGTPDPAPVNNFTLTQQDGAYVLSLSGNVNTGGFKGVIAVSGDVTDLTSLDAEYGTVYLEGDEIRFIWSHGLNVREGFDVLSFKTDGKAALVIEEIYAFDGSAIVAVEYHVNGI